MDFKKLLNLVVHIPSSILYIFFTSIGLFFKIMIVLSETISSYLANFLNFILQRSQKIQSFFNKDDNVIKVIKLEYTQWWKLYLYILGLVFATLSLPKDIVNNYTGIQTIIAFISIVTICLPIKNLFSIVKKLDGIETESKENKADITFKIGLLGIGIILMLILYYFTLTRIFGENGPISFGDKYNGILYIKDTNENQKKY